MAANDNSNVRSLERALKILNCFSREHSSLSLVEIADMVGMYPSTTSRLIKTLEDFDFIKRDDKSLRYSLGYKTANLGAVCLATETLIEIARPYLETLRTYYNETLGLYVIHKDQRVCIDSVSSTLPLRRVIDVGSKMSLTRGASGKLLLSYLPESTIYSLLENSPDYVTIDQLEEIRKNGYAISRDEHKQGLVSIAAPIFNAQQRIEAALFISGPMFRMTEEKIPDITESLIQAAHNISIKIGY